MIQFESFNHYFNFSYNNILVSPLDSLSLVDIGYKLGDHIDVIQSTPKNAYFTIKQINYQFILPISENLTVFDIKKYFSTKFFTVPKKIIVIYEESIINDDILIYDYDTTEKEPFIIEFQKDNKLYRTFFNEFNLFCLPSDTTYETLKKVITANSQKDKSAITTILDYKSKVDDKLIIQEDEIYEFTETNENKTENFIITVKLFEGNQCKSFNDINYSFSYKIDAFLIKCMIEKDFKIEKEFIVIMDSESNILSDNLIIEPNLYKKLYVSYRSPLYIKVNGDIKNFNYFSGFQDLKKIMHLENKNAVCIINNHYMCTNKNDNLIINFLIGSDIIKDACNIKIFHSNQSCIETKILVLNTQNEIEEETFIIDPKRDFYEFFDEFFSNYRFLLYLYTDIHSFYINIFLKYEDDKTEKIYFYVKRYFNILDFLDSLYKYKNKESFLKFKYDMFHLTFRKKALYSFERMKSLIKKDSKQSIYIKCYSRKKINAKIIIKDIVAKAEYSIDYSLLNAEEIINKLIKSKKIPFGTYYLYLEFNELENKNYPTLFETDLPLILNKITYQRNFIISNGKLLKVKFFIEHSEYRHIAQRLKSLFDLKKYQDVNFYYKDFENNKIIKLPPVFNAGSFPDNSIILISYKPIIKYKITFLIGKNSTEITISDPNTPINILKPEIQRELNLNDYSLKSIHFSFYDAQLNENYSFYAYKIYTNISVLMDETLKITIETPEITMIKYFSNGETINDVKMHIKNEFQIDYDIDLSINGIEEFDDTLVLSNDMIIRFNCRKINIELQNSLNKEKIMISDILLPADAIKYICETLLITNENIALFTYNKDEKCYEPINPTKRLIKYNELYLHEIVTIIEFDAFTFKPHDNEQISVLNTVNWFKNNYLVKLLFCNEKNINIKKENR